MTTTATEFTPYSTVQRFIGARPTFISEAEQYRLASYQFYEQVYWNVPDTFKLVMYDSDAPPIYIPTARTLIDTTNRYVGRGMSWIVEPGLGTPEEAENLNLAFQALVRRERFMSNYASNKRYGLIRGDWLWHVLGDPAKPQGSRIRVIPVDPAGYVPVTHPDDPDRIIAAFLFETIMQGDKSFIKRQAYTKGRDPVANDGSDTTIYNSIAVFEIDKWEALDDSAVTVLKPPTPLPAQITSIPLYHVKNQEEPGNPYGSSELRGYERIFQAVNQGISDQDLAIALEGLGMYSTDSGPPTDPETGQATTWKLGPGRVVERATGTEFDRVAGIGSLPGLDHLNWIIAQLKESSGLSDAATGKVDVSIAESGISLYLQLAPLLAKVDERNQSIDDVHTQMFFDLVTGWMPAYEALNFPNARLIPSFDDPVPVNKEQKVKEVIELFTAKIISLEEARAEINMLGYQLTATPDEVMASSAAQAMAADPFAARAAAEGGVI